MKETDRKLYCRTVRPYFDHPSKIGCGQTISAPHIHAQALEILGPKLKPDAKVLDGKKIIK
jgi:protein-L-isoaspartate(D-aspartate) O-methyltransferase